VPRQHMPVGSHGAITLTQLENGSWSARVYVRDLDGKRREASRRGRSRAAAERALRGPRLWGWCTSSSPVNGVAS
jgi:hypothetical protein